MANHKPSNGGFIKIQAIADLPLINELSSLKRSLLSSYGHGGRTKLIGSELDDQIKVGSSSTLLLNSALTDVNNAVIKLVVAAVNEHLKVYHDFGLYCISLSLYLIERGLKLDVTSCLVAECFRCFCHKSFSQLQHSKDCSIVKKIDIGNMKLLLSVISNVLHSKPTLLFKANDLEQFSRLILKAYLNCIPEHQGPGCVSWPVIHFVQSSDFANSSVYDGLLLDLHHYASDVIQSLVADDYSQQENVVLLLNISLTASDLIKKLPGNVENDRNIENVMQQQLKDFASHVVSLKISIVVNQKVICDQVKFFFQKHKVIAIDRIGLQAMDSLKEVTQAKVVVDIREDLKKCVGYIKKLTVVNVARKYFVHLENPKTRTSTLVICYNNLAVLEDLKHVSWAAVSCLDRVLRSHLVIEGGGSMEEYLTNYLDGAIKPLPVSDEVADVCSSDQWKQCLQCFCDCLKLFTLDALSAPRKNTIYDCYEAKVNAFMVAVQTACIALEIKYQITE